MYMFGRWCCQVSLPGSGGNQYGRQAETPDATACGQSFNKSSRPELGSFAYISLASSTIRLYGIAVQLSASTAPLARLIIEILAAVSSSGAS